MDTKKIKIRNKKIDKDTFFKERQEVLAKWPTGKDVDLDEAVEFHKSLPAKKVWVKKLAEAKEKGDIYPITGMGKATLDQQIELLKYVQNEGKADVLGTSVDSFSRVGNFEAAEKGIKESEKTGKSQLNGLPIVNHGVKGIRKIVESVDLALSLRYGAPDTRLIDEIGIAGGYTSTAAEGLFDYWQHNSKSDIESVLSYHQYVQRLAGYYEEKGVPICLSCQGLYAGGGVPPSLTMSAVLPQLLMMAEQGAKYFRLHVLAQGNLIQDVAGAKTLFKLAQEYFNKFGYKGIKLFMSVSLSLVKYPVQPGPAFAVIGYNSLIAKLCGAQVNDVRTAVEAITIPTKEDIVDSFRCAKVATNLLRSQRINVDDKALQAEAGMIEAETRAIVDKVIEIGDGDPVVGIIRGVESGVLDNPYASHPAVACRVIGVRDSEGAIRYLNTGNLPFTPEIVEFNKQKIAEREKKRGHKVDYETVVGDLLAIGNTGLFVEV